MSTKLPKGLEKLIEQKADTTRVYGALLSPHEQDIWIDGGTEIALEVLQRAEKLAEALEAMLKSEALKEAPFYSYSEAVANAQETLSDWQAWKEKTDEN